MVECTNCGRQWAKGLAYCSSCGGSNRQLPSGSTPANDAESADMTVFGCAAIAIIGLVLFITLVFLNSTSTPKKEQTQAEKDEETCGLVYYMTQKKPIAELTIDDVGRIKACQARGLYVPPRR